MASRAQQVAGATAPAEFDAAWEQFFGAIRRARARAAREVGSGELSLSQYHLVAALADGSRRPVGELAELAGVTPPTATRMLDGLARAGIVVRRASNADRRVVEIELTADGRRTVRRKRTRIAAKRRALYESLAPTEREQAERLLRRLAGLIEEL